MSRLSSIMKKQFVTGLVMLLPIGLTLIIIFALFKLVGKFSSPFLERVELLRELPEAVISVLSFLITLFIIWVIGIFATNVMGKRLVHWFENILLKMPFVARIYQSIRQIIQTVMLSRKAFHQVVMIEYPRKGIYTLAFVTNRFQWKERKMLSLFIPTTPNPTSGWFVVIPEEEAVSLKMSVEEGMKLIISGGIITPSEGRFAEGEREHLDIEKGGKE